MASKHTENRTHCIRCGTCCLKGGPALHRQDATLFEKGILGWRQVFTLRKGEAVRYFDGTLLELDAEMVKIKGQGDDWVCLFYNQKTEACTIYAQRPLECRALKCWDLRALKAAMEQPRLQRYDLLAGESGLQKLIAAHDKRCSYATLKSAVAELSGVDSENAIEKVMDLLQYDDFMRPFLTEKLGLDPATMAFLFGRPLSTTIRTFGLEVKEQGDEKILVPSEQHRSLGDR